MRPAHAFLIWFLIGTAAAALLQYSRTQAMGGDPGGLLFAGELAEVHSWVVDELPSAPIDDGWGHDGQIFYAVGLDLRGLQVPDSLISAPYRYRRILYPALASGFGLMDNDELLWGMILLTATSVGVAAGAVAAMTRKLSLSKLAPMAVVMNPGVWTSAILLTSDNLALALALVAVLGFVHRQDGWTMVGLAAAGLAKEPYLAFAIGLAGYAWSRGERNRAVRILAAAAVPVCLWWAYIGTFIGNPLTSGGQVVAPFTGLANAIPFWPNLLAGDLFFLGSALLGAALSMWVVIGAPRMWSWLAGPWLVIAIFSAGAVWELGHNAIRAFAPLLTLGVLGTAAAASTRKRRSATPASP